MNLFLINPQSEKAKKLIKKVKAFIETLKIEGEFIEVEKKEDLPKVVEEAKNMKVDRIIAIGGDGMINRMIPYLVKSDITLCIIPMGETNFFANILGIPNWKDGCKALLTGKEIAMNLGKAGDKYFVASVEIETKKEKVKKKKRFLFKERVEDLPTPTSISIQSDNTNLKFYSECFSILISTIPFPIPSNFNIEDELEKEDLNIIIKHRNIKKLSNKKEEITILQGKHLEIQSKASMDVKIDGDIYGKTPIEVEKTNHYLKVLKK